MDQLPKLPVNRCVCLDLPFADLKVLAQSMDLDFAALRTWSGCCTGCGTCEPYVRLMLETGATEFAVLTAEEAAGVVSRTRAQEKRPPG